jgi:hypothetical protein
MWKVSTGYFALSLLIVVGVMFSPEDFNASPDGYVASDFLTPTLGKFFLFFQPQFWFQYRMGQIQVVESITSTIPSWLLLSIYFISIPLWSICLGWLYVKFTNWLNHFPVLGRRVF